jgi:hypothetical protein
LVFDLLTGIQSVKAVAAVDGFIAARHKWNFRSDTAAIANRIIHGPIRAALAPAAAILIAVTIRTMGIARFTIATCCAAGGTTGRLVCKALLGEKLLFGYSERERGAAIAAGEGFVFKHGDTPLNVFGSNHWILLGWLMVFTVLRLNWNQETHWSNKKETILVYHIFP